MAGTGWERWRWQECLAARWVWNNVTSVYTLGRKHVVRVTGLVMESCLWPFWLWALSKSYLYVGLRGFQKVLPDLTVSSS